MMSLSHKTLACATAVAIALCCSSRHARLMRYPLPRCQPHRATGAVEAVTDDVAVAVTAVTTNQGP
jgi:hypothetical protein